MANNITFKEACALLVYEPESGLLRWRANRGQRVKAGDTAGCLKRDGYIAVKVRQEIYQAHRLAWLLTHGDWPKLDIDHINGDRSDNRLTNLRHVSRRLNCMNRHKVRAESGVLGASVRKSGKWQASLGSLYLGVYQTPQEAGMARANALREIERAEGN